MGYVSPNTLFYLAQSTIRVSKLNRKLKTVEYKNYAVFKAKQVIFKRPVSLTVKLFALISYDMAFFEPAGNGNRILTYFHDKTTGFNTAYTYYTKDQTTNIIIDYVALVKR